MDECNACNSISGVYYALCDDCMTKLNQLQADHQRLSRLLSASESRESVLRDENARLKEVLMIIWGIGTIVVLVLMTLAAMFGSQW